MFKNAIIALFTLFTFSQGQNAQAQCTTFTVEATDICLNYPTACGCDISNFTLVNFTPPAGVCVGANLFINGSNAYALSSNSADPFNGTISSPGQGYQHRLTNINTSANYMIAVSYDNGGVVTTCYSMPFTIGVNNTHAAPDFNTHWKNVSTIMVGTQAVTSSFYANDPITFDATIGSEVVDYILTCTPANSSGVATGTPVTVGAFYPANPTEAYLNLRTLFSGHLVNPSGMVATVYYLIKESATGCSGVIQHKEKLISINHTVRSIKVKGLMGPGPSPMVVNVSPNPSTGVVNVFSESSFENSVITLVSVEGREVYRAEGVESNRLVIDITNETEGIYFLNVESNEGVVTEKLIKQ